MKNIFRILILFAVSTLFVQCNTDDSNSDYVAPTDPNISNPNDQYLYSNAGKSFFERYGTATRWRWDDNFIRPDQRATPIRSEFVIPTTKVVDHLWIGPYVESGEGGKRLLEKLFPPEIVYIGSYIYKDDGSRLLGFAEGGARITLLNLNTLDFTDKDWFANPSGGILTTLHHEFSHIVHQNFGIPVGFNTISDKYLGPGWVNLPGDGRDDAIKLGMVRDYATSSEFEDFCEIISHLLVVDPAVFEEDFITQEDCSTYTTPGDVINCQELNAGRLLIKQKVDLVVEYYKNTFNIDLIQVRDILQSRLNNVIETGVIPE